MESITRTFYEKARGGDRSAYDQLFALHTDRALLFIRARLGPKLREKVESMDVLQDAYLAAHRDFDKFEYSDEGSFTRWLCQIIENRLRDLGDYFGAKKRQAVELPKSNPTGPATALDRKEHRERVAKALAKTPDRRYASVRAILEDIRRFGSGESVLARRPGMAYRAIRFTGRHWKLGAAAAVTAAVLLAIAPRLFDKSAEELIRWADEQHNAGEHSSAVRVYARAYRKTSGADRRRILESLLRCGREAGDSKFVAEAAQDILDVDPDVSFQEFDYAVAQAFAARQASKDPGRYPADQKRRLMELGEKRLLLVLASSHCKEDEKQEAEKHLAELRRLLAVLKTAADLVFEFPTGEPAELLRRAADPEGYEWSRGMAAFAAGFELEKSGDQPAALRAYRQAYELLRSAFPTYSGRSLGIQQGREIGPDREMKECRMIRQVFQSIRRLDPATPDTMRGGIRFRIVGATIPPEHVIYLQVSLSDPTLKDPILWPTPGGSFPTQLDQTVWVGVADGTYRLSVHQSGFYATYTYSKWRGGQKKPSAWTELDLDKLPEEVTIAGKTVELTIPARSLEVVRLLEPADDAPVDLRKEVFRWASVPGAQSYSIGFVWMEDIPGGRRGNPVYNAKSEATSICLGNVPEQDIEKLKPLSRGSRGTWTVNAYDANGRHIGACVEGRSFTVAHGAAEE